MTDGPLDCSITEIEKTTIREPQFGAINKWDFKDGGDGMESYADILSLENDHFIVAGAYTKNKKDDIYHPLIIHFDDRFKKIWEVRAESASFKTVQRILKTKTGIVALGDMRGESGNGLYLAFYDDKGKQTGEHGFFEPGGSVAAKSMVLASDGTGYLIAAQFTDATDSSKQYGLIYKISHAGKQIWKRAYRPGPTTVFQALQPTLSGNYIVAGQIVMNDRKSAGWAMRIDNQGAIGWQRTYPRGLAATLYGAAEFSDGTFLMTGTIRPLTGAKTGMAGWVMKTTATGAPLWQRYFSAVSYDYRAGDIIAYHDGRASVLVNGGALDSGHRTHARLMTLSPSGQVLQLEDYTDGQNASANRLVSGLGAERLLAGFTQTSFGENQDMDEPAPAYTYDGWAIAGAPLDLYEDPCAPPADSSPILP